MAHAIGYQTMILCDQTLQSCGHKVSSGIVIHGTSGLQALSLPRTLRCLHCAILCVGVYFSQSRPALKDCLPGPHAAARNCLMAKRKVPRPEGGADQAHVYHTVTFPSAPTTTPLSEDFSSEPCQLRSPSSAACCLPVVAKYMTESVIKRRLSQRAWALRNDQQHDLL
jgi:hypothetical protein